MISVSFVISTARSSHAGAWDEKLYLLIKEIQEAWDKLFHGIKFPPRPSCGKKSLEARSRIFENSKNAMIFSEKMEEAFYEAEITLKDDETYACTVCITKKPSYVSEAMTLDPLGQNVEGGPRFNYIMRPEIMKSVMNVIEQDTINYAHKGNK